MSILKICDSCNKDLAEENIYYTFTERRKSSKNRGFGAKHCCEVCFSKILNDKEGKN